MSAMGSWEWLEDTGGRITAGERVKLMPKLAATFGRFTVDRLRLALGASPRHSLGIEELWPEVPDSHLCREAEDEGRELQSVAVLNHGYRTWILGTALARIDGAALDPELFFAGALLHDLGLEHIEPGRCFTYRSALAAREAAVRAEVAADRALSVMDGIGMHITPGLRAEGRLGRHSCVGASGPASRAGRPGTCAGRRGTGALTLLARRSQSRARRSRAPGRQVGRLFTHHSVASDREWVREST